MPIIHHCSEPECGVLTMGVYCLQHELERQTAQDFWPDATDQVHVGAGAEAPVNSQRR